LKSFNKTIYQAIQYDKRYIPIKCNIVYYGQTEEDVIEWLENNGGGYYRNVLHQFEYYVKGRE
jgi:hypothetical protein